MDILSWLPSFTNSTIRTGISHDTPSFTKWSPSVDTNWLSNVLCQQLKGVHGPQCRWPQVVTSVKGWQVKILMPHLHSLERQLHLLWLEPKMIWSGFVCSSCKWGIFLLCGSHCTESSYTCGTTFQHVGKCIDFFAILFGDTWWSNLEMRACQAHYRSYRQKWKPIFAKSSPDLQILPEPCKLSQKMSCRQHFACGWICQKNFSTSHFPLDADVQRYIKQCLALAVTMSNSPSPCRCSGLANTLSSSLPH